jgi:hypothetical protein
VTDFLTQASIEIAERLRIRGDNSFSWVALLTPLIDSELELDSLRADLSALLGKNTRTIELENATFEFLRESLRAPADDVVILTASTDLSPEKWSTIDLMRSALERKGPIIFWLSMAGFACLADFAPNIRSFIGPTVFAVGPDGAALTQDQKNGRLNDLARYYNLTNDAVIRSAEAHALPLNAHFVEWLVLLGRGDLV